MIGVVASEDRREIVRDFFQLFKTPWEFLRHGRHYDVAIVAGSSSPAVDAPLAIYYSSIPTAFDSDNGLETTTIGDGQLLTYDSASFPVYTGALGFRAGKPHLLKSSMANQAVAVEIRNKEKTVIRLGYDLFAEVEYLLTKGQPISFAQIPTLDHHINLLRGLIVGGGFKLIEIPPAPRNSKFIVCLTHDVDFFGIRRHLLDKTFFGFLYRASIGSLLGFFKKRIPLGRLFRNWSAVLKLPFVYLGLARDFWIQLKGYIEIEGSLPSTFFFVPFKGRPGMAENGTAPKTRGVKYKFAEIAGELKPLLSSGREIALHGIDAWIDSARGKRELSEVASVSGQAQVGVRMHWLYFNEKSPRLLQDAGFAYDSTLGYNEAVGFKTGTAQAFCLPSGGGLMELPLIVMDTALFYPDRMNLPEDQAWDILQGVVKHLEQSGGVLTINWHHRSIAPERLWDDFYVRLLDDFKKRGAVFLTMSQAVGWFQKRRSARFATPTNDPGGISLKIPVSDQELGEGDEASPTLTLRVHSPTPNKELDQIRHSYYEDAEIP